MAQSGDSERVIQTPTGDSAEGDEGPVRTSSRFSGVLRRSERDRSGDDDSAARRNLRRSDQVQLDQRRSSIVSNVSSLADGAYLRDSQYIAQTQRQSIVASSTVLKRMDMVMNREQRKAGDFAWINSQPGEYTVAIAILLSALLAGVDTQIAVQGEDAGDSEVYDMIFGLQLVFVAFFFAELCLRIATNGIRYISPRNPAGFFDFVVLIAGVVEMVFTSTQESIANRDGRSLKAWGAMRIFRLLRLLRIVRLFSVSKELKLLVRGMLSSVKAVTWAMVLLGVLAYMGAIFCIVCLNGGLPETEEPCAGPVGIAHSGLCQEGTQFASGSSCTAVCALGYVPSVGSLACSNGALTPATFECLSGCAAPNATGNESYSSAISCVEGPTVEDGANCTTICGAGYTPSEASLSCSNGVFDPPSFECSAGANCLCGQCSPGAICPEIESSAFCTTACTDGERPSVAAVPCFNGTLDTSTFSCLTDCEAPNATDIDNALAAGACFEAEGGSYIADGGTCTSLCRAGYTPSVASLSCASGNFTPSTFQCIDNEALLAERAPVVADYFGSLGLGLFTHFMIITLEAWPDISDTMIAANSNFFWCLYFICFILITSLALMNLVTGVISERLVGLSQTKEPPEPDSKESAAFREEVAIFREGIWHIWTAEYNAKALDRCAVSLSNDGSAPSWGQRLDELLRMHAGAEGVDLDTFKARRPVVDARGGEYDVRTDDHPASDRFPLHALQPRIGKDVFDRLIEREDAKELLAQQRICVELDTKQLWEIIDIHCHGSLTFNEFCEGLLRLRGSSERLHSALLQCDLIRSHNTEAQSLKKAEEDLRREMSDQLLKAQAKLERRLDGLDPQEQANAERRRAHRASVQDVGRQPDDQPGAMAKAPPQGSAKMPHWELHAIARLEVAISGLDGLQRSAEELLVDRGRTYLREREVQTEHDFVYY